MGQGPEFGAGDGGGKIAKPGAPDLSAFLGAAMNVLGAVQGAEAIGTQIEAAAAAAVGAITSAQTTAMGLIEGKKTAALQAIESAKPILPSKNSAVEESEKHPIIR